MQLQDSSHPTGVALASGKSTRTISAARKRKAAAAIEMRMANATWAQIAQALGYPTPRAALVATEACYRDLLLVEDRTSLRQYASMRLDRLLAGVWVKATSDNDPEHLNATRIALEILRDHRKLWGLDAPTEIVVTSPTLNEIEAWVAQVQTIKAPSVQEFDIIEGEYTEVSDEPVPTE